MKVIGRPAARRVMGTSLRSGSVGRWYWQYEKIIYPICTAQTSIVTTGVQTTPRAAVVACHVRFFETCHPTEIILAKDVHSMGGSYRAVQVSYLDSDSGWARDVPK
jgi:hypothetical protein